MNIENLKPNTERTPEERKKLASKAGKASGEARRARKTFKELFEIALSVKDDKGLTEQEKIVLRAIEVAKATGNYKDIEATIGEKPTDKLETTIKSTENQKLASEYLEALKHGQVKSKKKTD